METRAVTDIYPGVLQATEPNFERGLPSRTAAARGDHVAGVDAEHSYLQSRDGEQAEAPDGALVLVRPLLGAEAYGTLRISIMSTSTTVKEVMRELATLEDPKMREANERRGDDHGVNLTHLRTLAKRLKTQHELAIQLWATGDTAARLLATLVCKPKTFSAAELDAMVRDIGAPKLLDWFIVNVVKPGRHAEELRLGWKDGDDLVGRAGWSLTTEESSRTLKASTSPRCSTRSRRR